MKMAIIVDPDFLGRLGFYADHPASQCFNCGTCVAVCPMEDGHFPRKMIRLAQLGAGEAILEKAEELWKCLHCGMCNATCPRDAKPGELMLGLRRYALDRKRRKAANV